MSYEYPKDEAHRTVIVQVPEDWPAEAITMFRFNCEKLIQVMDEGMRVPPRAVRVPWWRRLQLRGRVAP